LNLKSNECMQKVKIIVASLAFVVAIGGAFAFKKNPATLFKQLSPTSCVSIACHEDATDVDQFGNPITCPETATKYRTRSADGTTCSNVVTTAYQVIN